MSVIERGMSDYTMVLNGLRHCINLDGLEPNDTRIRCHGCPYFTEPTRCGGILMRDAAAAIEALEAKVADYEDTLKWHQKEFDELRAMIDDANARLEVGKAGNQYTLIEPKNKRYTLRCPKCGTVVGLMEVQE